MSEKILTLPKGTKNIENGAYAGRDDIEKVVIPEGVTEIGDEAFIFCDQMVSVTLLSTLQRIGKSAFQECVNLKDLSFPEGLEEIGDAAFCNCLSLEIKELPQNVRISEMAFHNVKNIGSVMPNSKTFNQINEQLRNIQRSWYKKLPQKYKDFGRFSSPFCFGVSAHARDASKPLIMYVGEEPKNWQFNDGKSHESDIEYLQKYALAYLESQIYTISPENSCAKEDYPDSFKRNRSPFWNFIRKIRDNLDCNVCWNDLDKLHGINEKNKTIPLCEADERELHKPFDSKFESLLLQEINLIHPEIVIFMGANYIESIKCALNLDENSLLEKPYLAHGKSVIDITTDCDSVFDYTPKAVLWMCHPAGLTRNKFKNSYYKDAIDLSLKIIHRKSLDDNC